MILYNDLTHPSCGDSKKKSRLQIFEERFHMELHPGFHMDTIRRNKSAYLHVHEIRVDAAVRAE